MQQWSFKVQGSVQGVFFRANTLLKANQLGLAGFVSNQSDGSVFVLAQGEAEALQTLYEFLMASPEGAKVDKVEVSKRDEIKEKYTEFNVV